MRKLLKPLLILTLTCSSGLYIVGCKNENNIEKQTQYDDSKYKGDFEVPQKGRIDQHPNTAKRKD